MYGCVCGYVRVMSTSVAVSNLVQQFGGVCGILTGLCWCVGQGAGGEGGGCGCFVYLPLHSGRYKRALGEDSSEPHPHRSNWEICTFVWKGDMVLSSFFAYHTSLHFIGFPVFAQVCITVMFRRWFPFRDIKFHGLILLSCLWKGMYHQALFP